MNICFLFSLFSMAALTSSAYAMDSCETIPIVHLNNDNQSVPYSTFPTENKIPPVFQIFPPIIYDLYYRYPYDENIKTVRAYAYALKEGKKISSAYLIESAQKLCCSRKLCPQTSDALIEACKNVAEGKPIDFFKPNLRNYDPEKELENKYMLIHQMPTLVRDICLSNPDDELERPLVITVFSKTEEKFATLVKTSEYGQRLYESNPTIEFQACLNSLLGGLLFGRSSLLTSPQTLLRVATEFNKLIFHNEIPSPYPYNADAEIENINTLINLFPPSLAERCHTSFTAESKKFLKEGNGNGRTFKDPKLYACTVLTLHALILKSSPEEKTLLEQCTPKFKSDIEYNIAWVCDAINRRSGEIAKAQHNKIMQIKEEFIRDLTTTKPEQSV